MKQQSNRSFAATRVTDNTVKGRLWVENLILQPCRLNACTWKTIREENRGAKTFQDEDMGSAKKISRSWTQEGGFFRVDPVEAASC